MQYVPCGHCEECRRAERSQWSFRLAAEIEALRRSSKVDWKVGFCTLTYGTVKGGYSRDMLPYLPQSAFVDPSDFVPNIPCFSRSHCRDFIKSFRDTLYKEYSLCKELAIRYFLASEFGASKKRPHYHALFIFPIVNGLTPEKFYSLLQKKWFDSHGFCFPKNFHGGLNNGRMEKPFIVSDDCVRAANYVSKYVCKDLDFEDSIKGYELDKKSMKEYSSFHLQSRSLGISCINGLSDSEKLDLLLKGKSFLAGSKLRPLPVYIRNKLVFDNEYVFEVRPQYDEFSDSVIMAEKRLVRRRANDFFLKHYKEIYDKKRDFWKDTFESMCSVDFFTIRQIEKTFAEKLSKTCSYLVETYSSKSIADFYLCYYGVPADVCFSRSPQLVWLSRYNNNSLCRIRNRSILDEVFLLRMTDVCDMVFGCLNFICMKETEQERFIREFSNAYKDIGV